MTTTTFLLISSVGNTCQEYCVATSPKMHPNTSTEKVLKPKFYGVVKTVPVGYSEHTHAGTDMDSDS